MTEDSAPAGAARQTPFTVYADPPWLLHLAGELDRDGASRMNAALEDPTTRDGTIGFELAGLTFIDSTGINSLCEAARRVGDRRRIILFGPTPQVRRILEICGLLERFDIRDHPPSLRTAEELDDGLQDTNAEPAI